MINSGIIEMCLYNNTGSYLFDNRLEIEQYKEIIDQMEDERMALQRKIAKMEKDMKRYNHAHGEADDKISELHRRLVQVGV